MKLSLIGEKYGRDEDGVLYVRCVFTVSGCTWTEWQPAAARGKWDQRPEAVRERKEIEDIERYRELVGHDPEALPADDPLGWQWDPGLPVTELRDRLTA